MKGTQQPSPLPAAGAVGCRAIIIPLVLISILKLPLLRRCLQQPGGQTLIHERMSEQRRSQCDTDDRRSLGVQGALRLVSSVSSGGSEAELAYTGSLTHHSARIGSCQGYSSHDLCWSVCSQAERHLVLRRDVQHRVQTVGERGVPISAVGCCASGHLVLQQKHGLKLWCHWWRLHLVCTFARRLAAWEAWLSEANPQMVTSS